MATLERQPISQASTAPTTKVAAGGVAGAVTIVLVYILGLLHIGVPAEVGSAFTVILSFVASYFVKERHAVGVQSQPAGEGRPDDQSRSKTTALAVTRKFRTRPLDHRWTEN